MAAARAKRADNYLDEPVTITKTTIARALELKEKAAALVSRRAAADQAHAAQSNRVTTTQATVERIHEHFTTLQDTYSAACMVDFEDFQDKLAQRLTALTSAFEAGGRLTGKQGMSVEAVGRSEELGKSFNKAITDIQGMNDSLRERTEQLTELANRLPQEVTKLNIRFGRAMELANGSDIEGDVADGIKSLADNVTNLSASIHEAEGGKPDYLDIEKRHKNLAAEVHRLHEIAAQQKQEMDDLRTSIPQLAHEYNGLIIAINDLAATSSKNLESKTRSSIKKLQVYELTPASDRKNLRQQQDYLTQIVRNARKTMRQVEKEVS